MPPPPSCPQVYMNAVWHGWAIPMFLFLAILRLSLNYLIARWVAGVLCARGCAVPRCHVYRDIHPACCASSTGIWGSSNRLRASRFAGAAAADAQTPNGQQVPAAGSLLPLL